MIRMLAIALLAIPLALAAAPFLTLDAPEDRPPGVDAGFGQLVGSWACSSESRQPDGTWQAGPGLASWDFYYALDGRAVQDVWRPPSGSPVGTNLRTYDPEADQWQMVWATASQARFDHFDATVVDGDIVMTGERWARGSFPAHQARITFHGIEKNRFDWRYDASGTGAEGSFNEINRIRCERKP